MTGRPGATQGLRVSPGAQVWGLGLALLLLLVPGAGEGRSGAAPGLSPGTEVFAVDPARVLEVSYRTPGFQVLAHRFRTAEAFTLIILKPGGLAPEWCEAKECWHRVLSHLTSLPLRSIPSRREVEVLLGAHPLGTWGELTVRDDSLLEPFRARVLPAAGSPGEVWLHVQGATYRVALPHKVLELLAGGCSTLAGSGAP